MVEFTFNRMVGSLLCLTMLTSCGLRDQLRAQRDQEKSDDTKHSIETTHDTEDKYQDQLADLAQKDLNSYRNYLQGVVGEYRGTYRTVAGRSGDDAITGQITVVIQAENDLGSTMPNSKVTADQYHSMLGSMTLAFLVTEVVSSGEDVLRSVCNQTGVKPDESTGRVHLACQTTGGPLSLDYTFILNENAALVAGSTTHIETIDGAIASPDGVSFAAKLQYRPAVAALAVIPTSSSSPTSNKTIKKTNSNGK